MKGNVPLDWARRLVRDFCAYCPPKNYWDYIYWLKGRQLGPWWSQIECRSQFLSPRLSFAWNLRCRCRWGIWVRERYVGRGSSKRVPLLKEKVCLVEERLVSDLLILSKEAVEAMQNLLLIILLWINCIHLGNQMHSLRNSDRKWTAYDDLRE